MAALDQAELEALFRGGESDRVEFKRDLTGAAPEHIREAIAGFANDLPGHGQPGVVFVGVTDRGACAGLEISEALLRSLAQYRDDGGLTPFPAMEVRRVSIDGCAVAAVIVEPDRNPPIRRAGRTWVRVGPKRAIATPEQEARLVEKRRWGNLPFDAQPVAGATLADLDLTRFRLEYLPALVSPDTIAQNQRSVPQQLRALRLIDAGDVPTATAILMLGITPQAWLAGARIAWRRVDGTNLTDATLDQRDLAGTLPDQLRRIDEIMDAANPEALAMTGARHTRTRRFPPAALQQLVRNAVMHRAYDGTAAPVRVSWYADRVEILSPGGPYGAVSAAAFGTPGLTDYRNPTLSEALKAYGFVERFGQGLEIVRETLAANGNPPVAFSFPPEPAPAWVHATVRAAP